jgi:hypothetical protein
VIAPSIVTLPASSSLENEDAVVVGDSVVVVVDGAGLPTELRAGCSHSVAWFAHSVAATFHARLAGRSTSMRDALAKTIAAVRDSHRTSCALADGSPSATVAAWRIIDEQLEYLVLCDASLVLVDVQDRAVAVTDQRLREVLDTASPPGTPRSARDPDVLRAARRSAAEAARNRAGGFWCVHHDPAAATRAIEGKVPLRGLSGVLACSDGGTRAYDTLGTHTLTDFAMHALRGDTAEIAATIRRAETLQTDDLWHRGLKVHDDLTIVAQSLKPTWESHDAR